MAEQDNKIDLIFQYEEKIRQLKGVISARIVTNDNGEIDEIHVLAGPNRGPKQVVRDIESILVAQFGMEIDHKKISVAQIQDDENKPNSNQLRPLLISVTLLTSSVHAEAKVQLKIGEDIFEGMAAGPSSSQNRLRLVVAATLKALEEYLRGTCSFVVEDLTITPLAGKEVAIVSVALITSLGEESLIGVAFVKNDEREAVVKATLGAVNRRLSLLLN